MSKLLDDLTKALVEIKSLALTPGELAKAKIDAWADSALARIERDRAMDKALSDAILYGTGIVRVEHISYPEISGSGPEDRPPSSATDSDRSR